MSYLLGSKVESNTVELIGYWNYRAADSLDQFLPLVNLHLDEKQTPKYALIHLYAILQVVVGWLIVPLLVAALAGIIKR